MPPAERPLLSLCLIVRDEAERIGRCLDAALPIADEIVVVDTGSTDGTAAIAEAKGARVVPFVWIDDFAAARNAALDAARGDWILMLDADEVLERPRPARLRTLLAEARDPAFTVDIGRDLAFLGLTVHLLDRRCLIALLQHFDGLGHVAIGRFQRLLAIQDARACHGTQFFNVLSRYCH